MNRALLTLVTTLACCVTSHAQLHLNGGDVFVCQFTTLRHTFSGGGADHGGFGIYGTLEPSSQIRCEMFENNISDSVLCSETFSEPRTNVYLGGCQSLGAWQDQQGIVRLTMLLGTAELKFLYFAAAIPSGNLFRSYEAYAVFPPAYTLTVSNNGLGSVNRPGASLVATP